MYRFGEKTGMAFQIKDDLFDYSEDSIGKPTGIDIKERKMTLPLIYALNHADSKRKKWIIRTLKNYNTDKKRVQELIEYVKQTGGLDYARKKMMQYVDEAKSILEAYPANDARESLLYLLDYVVTRKI